MQKFKEEKGVSSIIVLIIIIIILLFAIASALIIGIKNGKILLRNKEENKNITQSNDEEDESYLKYIGKTDDGGLYVDKNGNKKILDSYGEDISYKTHVVGKDSKVALEKLDGNIIVNLGVYDDIYNIKIDLESSKYYIVRKNDKFGIIDYEGKVIIPLEYDNISPNNFGKQNNRSEDGEIFICRNKKDESKEYRYIFFNSHGMKVFECEGQASNYDGIVKIEGILLDNGVSVMAVMNKISGETYLINVTSSEVLKKYDKLDDVSSYWFLVDKQKKSIFIKHVGRILVINNYTGYDKDNVDIYFFNKEKKKSLTMEFAESKNLDISKGPYYYVINKEAIYNEYGEKIRELNGSNCYVYTSAVTKKTYFGLGNAIYDEQFKEIDSGNITECTGDYYLKDGIVYTMDKQEVAKDVKYLSSVMSSNDLENYKGSEISEIKTNDDKKYLLRGTDKMELPSSYSELKFIGNNREYFSLKENNEIIIYSYDELKELWRIKNDSTYYVDDKCNVIKVGKKYYNFKGEELYEEK